MESAVAGVVEPLTDFAIDSVKLLNKCNKPDKKGSLQSCSRIIYAGSFLSCAPANLLGVAGILPANWIWCGLPSGRKIRLHLLSYFLFVHLD